MDADRPLCLSQVKSAASYALGSIAVGNLPEYLPFVLQEISSSKRQYLLLHSLKEIISKRTTNRKPGFKLTPVEYML